MAKTSEQVYKDVYILENIAIPLFLWYFWTQYFLNERDFHDHMGYIQESILLSFLHNSEAYLI